MQALSWVAMKYKDAILASRWAKPFAHMFDHPALWHLNRRSVPRGLAIGLFAAFIVPVGQFALAALAALPLRANVPLAASATLVTNPLTFPPIYFAAYKLGSAMLGMSIVAAPAGAVSAGAGLAAGHGVLGTVLGVSGPTALGLFTFAVVSAPIGFVAGSLWWRVKLVRRWRGRRGFAVRAARSSES